MRRNGLNVAGVVLLMAWMVSPGWSAASERSHAEPQNPRTHRGMPGTSEEPTGSILEDFSLDGSSGEWARAEQGRSASVFSSLATILPVLLSTRRGEGNQGSNQINVADLLRMFGVDTNKVGTIVINAIVHIIEMVGNRFLGGSNTILDSRKLDFPGAFFFKLFDTRRAEKFLRLIANPDYPNNIINDLKAATGNDTVCIQQLICKLSPFWWGVNRSVRDFLPLALGKDHSSPLLKMGWKNLFMKYVPSVKDFSDNSDLCETRYSGCIVMSLMHKTNSSRPQH